MMKKVGRWAKGTLVSGASAYVCYVIWAYLWQWAEDASIASQSAMGAGWTETVLAELAGLLSMPVMLWAGMRLLGARGNHVLILGGAVMWSQIGSRTVDGGIRGTAAVPSLTLFAVVGGLL